MTWMITFSGHVPGCWTPAAAETIFTHRFHSIQGRRAVRAAGMVT